MIVVFHCFVKKTLHSAAPLHCSYNHLSRADCAETYSILSANMH